VGKGTGLRLSISYGIVQDCGGSIAVESAPGEGARFIIDLPVLHEAREGG
jgi:histidine kinase